MTPSIVSSRYDDLAKYFRLMDLFVICFSAYACLFFLGFSLSPYFFILVSASIICYYVMAEMVNMYSENTNWLIGYRFQRILVSWFGAASFLYVVGYFLNYQLYLPSNILFYWFFSTPVFLLVWRLIIKYIRSKYQRHRRGVRNLAILGANPTGEHLRDIFKSDYTSSYKFCGFYDDRYQDEKRLNPKLKQKNCIVGNFEQAVIDAQQGKIDVIYIVLPMAAESRIAKILSQLSNSTTEVHIIPNFFVYNLLHARWHHIGSYSALSIYDSPFFYGFSSVLKRIEDIVLGSIILCIIAIPMVIIGALIKITSPQGPIIFKQKRYGIGGQEVTVWKFRTMTVCEDGNKVTQATKNDTRVTPLGGFLRKTSLDEFPQFINVLQGTMSIVGPRPHAIAHNEFYRTQIQGYMLRHMVKPGITGLAQINGLRGETRHLEEMQDRINYDLEYITNWSLPLDIKIIFLTIFKGFINKKAY